MERMATDDIPAFIGGREGEGRRALITGLRAAIGTLRDAGTAAARARSPRQDDDDPLFIG